MGKKNNRNAEEWKGFSSLATSTYYHRWRHPKINVTILSKIGRSIRVSTNRETTYPDARELAISEIIPVHNASVLLRILKKKKTREEDWKWEGGYVACFGSWKCLFFRGGWYVGIILCFRRIRNRIIGFLWWNDIWQGGQKLLGNEFVSFAMLWAWFWGKKCGIGCLQTCKCIYVLYSRIVEVVINWNRDWAQMAILGFLVDFLVLAWIDYQFITIPYDIDFFFFFLRKNVIGSHFLVCKCTVWNGILGSGILFYFIDKLLIFWNWFFSLNEFVSFVICLIQKKMWMFTRI